MGRSPSAEDNQEDAGRPTVVRVLVIDDDELDFLAVKRLLRKTDGPRSLKAIHANSLEQGYKFLKATRFDVALVDYFLGSACGLDLIRRLGGRSAETPMVVLTGSRDPVVLGEIIDAGITNYLSKDSLDGGHLRRILLSAIEQHRTDLQMLKASGILIDKSMRIPGLGYFDYQVDRDILMWSRESYLIWGVVPGEFAPAIASVRSLVHPDDHRLMDESFALESTAGSVELRVLMKGGGERRVRVIINRVGDEHGKVFRLHGIYHDVTAHRLAEVQLQSQQRKYQQLFDSSDISLWLVDCSAIFSAVQVAISHGENLPRRIRDGSEFSKNLLRSLKVTDSNRAADNLLGYQAKSQTHDTGFTQQWIIGLLHDLTAAMADNARTLRVECVITTRSGDRSAVVSLPVPGSLEDACSVPVTIIDLTDIHNAELANRANVAKSAFLARMSHELRTPLNGIVANIDLLDGTILDDEQDALVSSAQSSAGTLLQLIGDILDFSKIEAGRLELERISLDVQDVILNIDSMVQAKAAIDGISFSWRIDGNVPLKVEGDPLRLKQVLLNLTANAIRHTKTGGVYLKVSATPIDQQRSTLRFDIVDSGCGLDPQASGHIFNAFVQADGSSARVRGGTGLGLAIAKSIVDLWSGEIGFDGRVGEGAQFWFTLPVRVIEGAPESTAAGLQEAICALNMPVRALVLRSADRADRQIERYLQTWTTLCTAVDDERAALSLCDAQAAKGEAFTFCCVEEPQMATLPSGIAGELLARNVMPALHLSSQQMRHLKLGLRAGFTSFFPPDIEHATELRNVALTMRHIKIKGEKALRRWGPADNPDKRLLRQLKDSLRILILEDQPMNQLIIERQMARLGLNHDVVENGVLGLERMNEVKYSLILCDCSMPRMDGYEFTRNVRRREELTGSPRIPIIALTANVFVEDVARCKAAGMDDFIAKPVELDRLVSGIIAWTAALQASTASGVSAAVADSSSAAVDLKVLPSALGTNDAGALAQAYRLFLSESRKHGARLRQCALQRRAPEIKLVAHGAKGDSRSAGAVTLADLLQTLEQAAVQSNWGRIDDLIYRISAEQDRVAGYIERHALAGMAHE